MPCMEIVHFQLLCHQQWIHLHLFVTMLGPLTSQMAKLERSKYSLFQTTFSINWIDNSLTMLLLYLEFINLISHRKGIISADKSGQSRPTGEEQLWKKSSLITQLKWEFNYQLSSWSVVNSDYFNWFFFILLHSASFRFRFDKASRLLSLFLFWRINAERATRDSIECSFTLD